MIGRILVVDDDKDHAESIADLLNGVGMVLRQPTAARTPSSCSRGALLTSLS
jgi:CheY-like chemotaxis protein